MSAHERTGWRCQDISKRHREWGLNCPAVDLDFVMVEYNHGLPVALVEYKHKSARIETQHPTYNALRALADGYKLRPLPFFIAQYCPEQWWFRVVPLNDAAARHFPEDRRELSEQRFVRGIYRLRKSTLNDADEECVARLRTDAPSANEAEAA
jgi:hypothetical protein